MSVVIEYVPDIGVKKYESWVKPLGYEAISALSQAAAVAKLDVEHTEVNVTVGVMGAAVGAAVPSQMLSPAPVHTKTSVFRLEILH